MDLPKQWLMFGGNGDSTEEETDDQPSPNISSER